MHMRIVRLAVFFAVFAAISITTGTGLARGPVGRVIVPSGALDTSFDTDGKFQHNFGQDDRARGVVTQPDGKVVVVGTYDDGLADFAIARLNPDGTPDTDFGGGDGFTTATFGNVDFATGVALQSDGKIVVSGYTNVLGDDAFAALRLLPDGTPDASFDGDGRVIVNFNANGDRAMGVVIQPDGKIVLGGVRDITNAPDFAVARLNPADGSLDGTFNGTGMAVLSFGGNDFGQAVALDHLGRIVVAGYTNATGNGANDFAIGRFTSDGLPDAGFDTDGKFTVDFGNDDRANGVVVQPDARIVAAGSWDGGSSDFAVVRLTTDGALDSSFSGNGRFNTTFGTSGFGGAEYATSVALQANGKIVVAGYTDAGSLLLDPFDVGVIRLTAGGVLDPSFDTDGKMTIGFIGNDQAHAVAVQPDGNLVVAGFASSIITPQPDFIVARLGGDPPVDHSFSTDGRQTVDFGSDDRVNGLAVQPDGKVIAVGQFAGCCSDFAVARFNLDGSLDNSFSGNGRFNTSFVAVGVGQWEVATAVALQNDGKIVVVGYTDLGVNGGQNDFGIIRLTPEGTLDLTFDGDGKQTIDFGADDRANAVAIQPDGKIVVAGSFDGGVADFAVARLNPDGSLDPMFSGNGLFNTSFSAVGFGRDEFATGVALQHDGKIVVAGYTDLDVPAGPNDFFIIRLTAQGTLDPEFDTDGKQTIAFGADDRARSVAIQPDGKIVVAGSYDGGSSNFAIARLLSNGTLDNSFNGDGRANVTFGIVPFGGDDFAYGLVLQPNGKIVVAGYTNVGGGIGTTNFAMTRLTSTGIADSTFHNGGKLIYDFGGNDQARAAALHPDGGIVVAGFSNADFPVGVSNNFAVIRLFGTEAGVTHLYPSSGSTQGGTSVAIYGAGLLPGATVTIGGVPATNVEVTPGLITAVTGAHAAGPVNVEIVNGPSIFTLTNGYTYVTPPANPTTDTDGDGIPDEWELFYGLDPLDPFDATHDPDGDGVTNLDEYLNSSHPRGLFTRYLSEGATSDFFNMQIALLNANGGPSSVLLRFLKSDGTTVPQALILNGSTRATIDPEALPALTSAEFSTVVESDKPIVVDRTMTWTSTDGYGSHAETSVASPSLTWYLAEGATHSGFNLFYLLQNANAVDANVQVTYLLPAPAAPVVRNYVVTANSRFNIWVDLIPELDNTDVSAIITSANVPIIVERAMYLDAQGLLFGAGHESAGVTSPATSWFLAEGATGSFFDLFVLIANPNGTDANVQATYLLPNGSTVVKNYVVTANSRFNIWVDLEGAELADTAVSTTITSSLPVIVERAMWWPGSSATWHEAHNSPGSGSTGTIWALAEGEVTTDGRALETYILLANTSAFAGTAQVTLYFEDGTSVARNFPLNGNSRTNVAVGIDFPEAVNRRFGAVIQSLGGPPAQIVVERAMYSNASGVVWAAGTNALATKVQ